MVHDVLATLHGKVHYLLEGQSCLKIFQPGCCYTVLCSKMSVYFDFTFITHATLASVVLSIERWLAGYLSVRCWYCV